MANNQNKKASHFSASGTPAPQHRPQVRSSQQEGARATRTRTMSSRTQKTIQRTAHKAATGGHARRSAQQQRPNSGSNHLLVGGVIGVLVVAMVAAFVLLPRVFSRKDSQPVATVANGQTVTVTIPDGSDGATIAKILKDAGLLTDTAAFFRSAQAQQAETLMKSGTYDIMGGLGVDELVKLLVSGPNSSSGRLTIAEGLTSTKIAQAVQEKLGISADDFLEQAKASNYSSDYPFLVQAQDDSLEGFLYPKTYSFDTSRTASADEVIRAMLSQYQAEVASLDFSSAKATIEQRYGVTMSEYDMLTLASIIEKEALTDEDRYNISSVMYNRMKAGMPLQSDATMGYVTGGNVTAEDLKKESPYNTYLHKGLTPTPICSPSMASIKAAMAPADTKYLYFWITEDNHSFSETYDQHQRVIANAKSAS